MNHRNRRGYFFIEALVAMMIVSVVLGGTLTLLSRASSISQDNKRQITELMLCEELMENLRQQWFSSPVDPITKVPTMYSTSLDDEPLSGPLGGMGWRNASVRCPWPAALDSLYSGQYRILPLLTDSSGEQIKRVQPGTLFQLQVSVQAINQEGVVSLFTFLPVVGVPVTTEGSAGP